MVGDFNINILNDSTSSKELLTLFNSHNLSSLIFQPTRELSKTCIDHVYADLSQSTNIEIKVLKFDFLDHNSILVSINFPKSPNSTLFKSCVHEKPPFVILIRNCVIIHGQLKLEKATICPPILITFYLFF